MVRWLAVRVAVGLFFSTGLIAIVTGTEPSDIDGKISRAFARVSPAVVRVAVESTSHSGVGTVVSPDGDVVVHAIPSLKNDPLLFLFANGRQAKGKLLSWSEEWNVSLAKITDPGPWPFVEMAKDWRPRKSQRCFAIGYTLTKTGWTKPPERRDGVITRIGDLRWFESSIRSNAADEPFCDFGPIIDSDGKLIGNEVNSNSDRDSIILNIRQIETLWGLLTHTQNMDIARLGPSARKDQRDVPYVVGDTAKKNGSNAEQHMIETTVRLREKKSAWSGVIVSPNGFIATCAHGGNRVGIEVVAELSDGSNVAGRVVGANPITDLAIVKLKGDGPWPYAVLSDTSQKDKGSVCYVVGHPTVRSGRKPLVRQTKTFVPKDEEWSHLLFTDPSCTQYGGDSGGGVFDANGKLLGITQGKEPGNPGRHVRTEALRVQWDSLAGQTDDTHTVREKSR